MAATAAGIRAGRAYVELGTKDSGLTKGLRGAQSQVQTFGKSIGAMGAQLAAASATIIAPLSLAIKQFADFGSQLHDMSKGTGLSVELIGQLKFAADQSGGSINDIATATKKMAKVLFDAKDGSAGAQNSLAKLGLTVNELLAMKPDDRFLAIAKALSQVEDETMRAALAQEVFGKAGTNLLPMLADGWDTFFSSLSKATGTMSAEAAAAADALGDALGSLAGDFREVLFAIGAELAPALTGIAEDFRMVLPQVRDFIAQNGEWIKTLAKVAAGLGAVAVAAVAMGRTLAFLAATNPWFALALVIAAATIKVKELADEYEKAADRRRDFERIGSGDLTPEQRKARDARFEAFTAHLMDRNETRGIEKQLNGFTMSVAEAEATLNHYVDAYDPALDATLELAESLKRAKATIDAEQQARLDAMETDARIEEIERDGLEAWIETLNGQMETAREMSEAGGRRAGMAQLGSQEFAQAIAEHMSQKEDKLPTLLQRQIALAERQLRDLDGINRNTANVQLLGVIQ